MLLAGTRKNHFSGSWICNLDNQGFSESESVFNGISIENWFGVASLDIVLNGIGIPYSYSQGHRVYPIIQTRCQQWHCVIGGNKAGKRNHLPKMGKAIDDWRRVG